MKDCKKVIFMKLIVLGAPGAGKGTQASMLSEILNIPHISTGDIFRANIKMGTELGVKAKQLIDRGMLVSDDITNAIIEHRLKENDCNDGFILDGFPRTIVQAKALDAMLGANDKENLVALYIQVDDSEIVKRMSGRRVCPKCSRSYHILYNPTKVDSICDDCNEAVIQRNDDTEETVLKRLSTFHQQTEPLIEYYNNLGKLVVVKGKLKVEETSHEVLLSLGVIK